MLKIKRIQTAFNQRMVVIEKEIEEISLKVFGDHTPKRQRTIFRKISDEPEETKPQEDRETEKGLEGYRLWQPSKVEPMDMEKLALVQKYLEDVHETRSLTTEASDSALGTQAVVSEIETEEISEADRLCLKDLSRLVTDELNQRLRADAAAMEKVSRFFGLKGDPFSFSFLPIENFFPDTSVSVLKECFEALRLEDLAEILAKVKPRALCPALSPEAVKKLQLSDHRTKHYSNMAVLVVNIGKEKGIATMIEKFFKDLNPRNEVCVIPFTNLDEKYLVQRNIKQKERVVMFEISQEKQLRNRLEIQLPELKKRIDGEGQENSKIPEEGSMQRLNLRIYRPHQKAPVKLESLIKIEMEERSLRAELEYRAKNIAKFREDIKRETEWIEDIERENSNTKSDLLTVMDKWIQDQGGSTFIAVFLICSNLGARCFFQERLHESIDEKLASIPERGKLVVSPPGWKTIGEIPEILHITLGQFRHDYVREGDDYNSQLFTSFIEIFKKRWPSSDLISMVREFKRTWPHHVQLMDNLSTLPRF